MSFFVVKKCTTKACVLWRLNNQCAQDGLHIQTAINRNKANTHPASLCEVRRQINLYKLKNLLEK